MSATGSDAQADVDYRARALTTFAPHGVDKEDRPWPNGPACRHALKRCDSCRFSRCPDTDFLTCVRCDRAQCVFCHYDVVDEPWTYCCKGCWDADRFDPDTWNTNVNEADYTRSELDEYAWFIAFSEVASLKEQLCMACHKPAGRLQRREPDSEAVSCVFCALSVPETPLPTPPSASTPTLGELIKEARCQRILSHRQPPAALLAVDQSSSHPQPHGEQV